MAVRTIPQGSYDLPEAEGRAIFNQRVLDRLKMTGDEFLTLWRAGFYTQDALVENDDLMEVAMLLPLVENDIGVIKENPHGLRNSALVTIRLVVQKATSKFPSR